MSEYQIELKNERLAAILDEAWAFQTMSPKKKQTYISSLKPNDEELCESIVGSYALDVYMQGKMRGVHLNFSYETLESISAGIQGVFQGYREMGRDLQRSGDLTARSYAAYLFLMAINEHDCHLHSRQIVSALRPQRPEDGPLWMDERRILTGLRREEDFLLPVTEGLVTMNLGSLQVLTIEAKPIVRAWKSAMGVDLSAYGLGDIKPGI